MPDLEELEDEKEEALAAAAPRSARGGIAPVTLSVGSNASITRMIEAARARSAPAGGDEIAEEEWDAAPTAPAWQDPRRAPGVWLRDDRASRREANERAAAVRAEREAGHAARRREEGNVATAGELVRAFDAEARERYRTLLDRLGLSALYATNYTEAEADRISDTQLGDVRARLTAQRTSITTHLEALATGGWGAISLRDPEFKEEVAKLRALIVNPATTAPAVAEAIARLNVARIDARVRVLLREQWDEVTTDPERGGAKMTASAQFHTRLATAFAERNKLPTDSDSRKSYQRIFRDIWGRPAPPVRRRDGIISQSSLDSFCGGATFGQRYFPATDLEWDGWKYHLSVSYTPESSNVRITSLHVTFREGGSEPRYWFNVRSGVVTPSDLSGRGHYEAMRTRAYSLVRKGARRLPLDVTAIE